MANYNSLEADALLSTEKAESKGFGGKVRLYKNEFKCDSQASGSTLTCQPLPENGVIVAIIMGGTSTGTATVKVGDADDDDAYFGAAVVTSTTVKMPAVNSYVACGGKTPVATTGTAALPGSGEFFINFLVAENR